MKDVNLGRKPKNKSSLKRKAFFSVIALLSIFILIVGGGVAVVYHYIGKINIQNGDDEIYDSIDDDDVDVDSDGNPLVDTPTKAVNEIEEAINENIGDNAVPVMKSDDVINILLIGNDARSVGERGRSDSMILVSLNTETHQLYMTSFMRDLYVKIPGKGFNRINTAYAYGGAKLLMQTIELNFRIKIDKYVQVNFTSFIEIIDIMGGIEITVTDQEAKSINADQISTDKTLKSGGTYTLSGNQALAYCRIRKIDSDFKRTERQRTLITKVIQKAKTMSVSKIDDLLDAFLPKITTNFTKNEIFAHALKASTYLSYDITQLRVPAESTWWNLTIKGKAVLGINFKKNVEILRSNIYKD